MTKMLTAEKANHRLRHVAPWAADAAVVKVEDAEPGAAAPAWYNFKTGDITIAVEEFNDLDDTLLAEELAAADGYYPDMSTVTYGSILAGLLAHEAAHSAWSGWLVKQKNRPAVNQVLRLFEELRIEKRAVDDSRTRTRYFLRSSFTLIAKTIEPPTTVFGAAHLWALTVGRAKATIVFDDEVRDADDMVRSVLDDELLDELHEILDEAIALDPTRLDDYRRILELAERWLELTGDPGPDDTDGTEGELTDDDDDEDDGDGSPRSSDEGDGTGAWREITAEESEWLREAIDKITGHVEAAPSFGGPGGAKTADPRTAATKVFGRDPKGRSWHRRNPTSVERQAVTRLARELEGLSYTAPHVTLVPALVPPGRLNTREGMRMAAERSRGAMVTAKPWQKKRRRHVQNPPLTIGLMTDTSGSMRWAQESVASAAYVFANAVSRVSGRFASVTFGDRAEAVVKPGQVPAQVLSRAADGGTEEFDWAVAALDGVLHLTSGRGARVLVVVSDNELVKADEPLRRSLWIERMKAAGVAIVWVGARNGDGLRDVAQVKAADFRSGAGDESVLNAIAPIAKAMQEALAKAKT